MPTWSSLLDQLDRRLGPVPRKFTLREWWHQRLPQAPWDRDVFSGWHLIRFLQHARLRRGRIVYGAFVQFSSDLKSPGKQDGWGQIIFSLDPIFAASPYLLVSLAQRVRRLRDTPRPKGKKNAEGKLWDRLSNAACAWPPLAIPPALTDGAPVMIVSVMVRRRHLPIGRIVNPIVPIAADAVRGYAAIVPVRYWPEPLQARALRLYSHSHNWRKWFHVS
jgi:hypothetical protein